MPDGVGVYAGFAAAMRRARSLDLRGLHTLLHYDPETDA